MKNGEIMSWSTFKLLSSLLIITLGLSCGDPKPQMPVNTVPTVELPEDFNAFYDRFHRDSAFQMEHISWPLSGAPSAFDTTFQGKDISGFTWAQEDWVMHKPFDSRAEFDREYEVLGDNMVNEVCTHQRLGVEMVRRFAKTSDGWKLIYYSAP
jgi:hypothetical protein